MGVQEGSFTAVARMLRDWAFRGLVGIVFEQPKLGKYHQKVVHRFKELRSAQ
jgi:hypothetical protein